MEKKKGILILIIGLIIFNMILLIPDNKDYQIKEDNIAKEEYNSLSMYIVDGEEETPTNNMPNASEYELDSKSYCLRGKDKLTDVLKNIDNNFAFTNLKTDDKCYLYFSKKKTPSEKTLSELELHSQGAIITGPSCNGDKGSTCWNGGTPDNKKNNMTQNGVYSAEDDFGKSYVFRGTVNDNWVKFGQEGSDDIWWRIIRVNGNGTIRLIYAGTGTDAPATDTSVTQTNKIAFNSAINDNTYVGFKYGQAGQTKYDDTHKNTNKSTIMGELESWWGQTTLGSLSSKIDVETGFCNDRQTSVAAHGSYGINGWGTQQTVYAPWDRLLKVNTTDADATQRPTLKCGYKNGSTDKNARKRDLFTGPSATAGGTDGVDGKVEGNNELIVPIGLITSDEVVFAGGFMYQNNNGYWLHTDQNYWTMSPFGFDGSTAYVFCVRSVTGELMNSNRVNNTYGVRPVINLKADTQFKFDAESKDTIGTTSNPYIVQ